MVVLELECDCKGGAEAPLSMRSKLLTSCQGALKGRPYKSAGGSE
jgi:hypothetical protein